VSALDRRNGVLTPFRLLSPAERSFVDTLHDLLCETSRLRSRLCRSSTEAPQRAVSLG
jgi:hypothetical protein